MNCLQYIRALLPSCCRLPAVVLALFWLTLSAVAARAQGAPPNMDFYEYISSGSRCSPSGGVFVGNVGCDVAGRIRNGSVSRLFILIRPDTLGPYRLEEQEVFYDASNPNHSAYAPLAQWYNVSSTTKRLVISNVRATQEFYGTSTYSLGVARVEITFVSGAPGTVAVSYTHTRYARTYGTPTLPTGTRATNGLIFRGSPLYGRRLYYVLL